MTSCCPLVSSCLRHGTLHLLLTLVSQTPWEACRVFCKGVKSYGYSRYPSKVLPHMVIHVFAPGYFLGHCSVCLSVFLLRSILFLKLHSNPGYSMLVNFLSAPGSQPLRSLIVGLSDYCVFFVLKILDLGGSLAESAHTHFSCIISH